MVTQSEFHDWLHVHEAGFPGFTEWWQTADSQEQLRIRARLWQGRLSRYSLNQMIASTEAMFEAREKPKYFGEHLDWICNRLNPRPQHNASFSHGQKCEACNGTGIVSVIFFDQRYTVGGNPLEGNRGPAACRCGVGRHLNERRGEHPDCARLPEWIGSQMAPDVIERPTPEEVQECRERLSQLHPGWCQVLQKLERRMAQRREAVNR